MDFNGWEMLVMFSESDLGTLELAYVHAKAIKKKSALEQTFIILYKKLEEGKSLSKVEERTVRDYLRVYRSEFAAIKKKAQAEANLDKEEQRKKIELHNHLKTQGIVMNEASREFLKEAKRLRELKALSPSMLHRLLLFCLGFIKAKDKKFAASRLNFKLNDKNFLFLRGDYSNNEENKFISISFLTKKIDEIDVLIPAISLYVGEDRSLVAIYLSNFNTRKQVILNFIDTLNFKDKALELTVRAKYERFSDELMFFEKQKVIESLSPKTDRSLVRFIQI